MLHFHYLNNNLLAEDVSVKKIADQVSTPCYVYSRAAIESQWLAFDKALKSMDHLVCYAVKANSNLAVLNILARLGSGFDIVSQGELERVLKAGGQANKIVFSGISKKISEIDRALEVGIYAFNVESIPELHRLNEVAEKRGQQAPIFLRINPDVDAKTHPYIATGLKENKFGIPPAQAETALEIVTHSPHLKLMGVACHIGSQLLELSPFMDALEKISGLVRAWRAKGHVINQLNLGGGLGVCYKDEAPPSIDEYAQHLVKKLANENLKLLIEPGRAIVANAGILVTTVEYIKQSADKNFAIVDAGMNDLIRPALYEAWHNIIPVKNNSTSSKMKYDVVGPVCETADIFGKNRELRIASDDLLAIQSAGAYGFTMSSNYNSRPRCAEVMVDRKEFKVVRERETFGDLMHGENIFF
jgi:diaminopimelate decarboxylase